MAKDQYSPDQCEGHPRKSQASAARVAPNRHRSSHGPGYRSRNERIDETVVYRHVDRVDDQIRQYKVESQFHQAAR